MTTSSLGRDTAPTVFVVDDDPAVRKSLRWLIESVGLRVRTYESAHEFLEHYDPDAPGCVVLDVRMPGMSGLDLQQQLHGRGSFIPIIIMTAYGDIPMAVRSMKAGALHFFEKPVSDQVLLDQIQQAIAEDARNRRDRADRQQLQERLRRLTLREQEVMEKVVEGMSSKEIGRDLGVSFKTVEAHRAKIMKKMEATSIPHLIRSVLLAQGRTPTTVNEEATL